ncbi:MAG TPA: metallophosphoesterase [Bryobacteraceae bacterium]|nr:metallophosphoesterase [Bryobacteraceae bacterium]
MGREARVSRVLLCALIALSATAQDTYRFVIIGDRTGEHVAGVYEEVWKELAAEKPMFVLSVGDTIEGLHDDLAAGEWSSVEGILKPYSNILLYLTPGNHDIWSPVSESLFRQRARRDPRYSFDYAKAHFTILDNSRTEDLPESELAFAESDLKSHAGQKIKFVVSHRPSWIINALVGDGNFPLQRIAKKYGVGFVISGHVHQMFHADLDGIEYVSMESAGGHLRDSGKYEDGWFFGYTVVDVSPAGERFTIHELGAPYGKDRTTDLTAWGKAGLINRR